jgi:hypothetical protein
MSRWAKSCSNGRRTRGSGIQALTDDEAKEWLEYHGKTKQIKEFFGE